MGAEPSVDQWFDACRRIVSAQRELFARTAGIAARTEYAGIGEGGDRSLVLDRDAEQIAFTELELLHSDGAEFTAISEERGEVEFGDGLSETRVVIDPIDGSLNARRTMPSFAFSLAVASGPSMADVGLGFVHDFGSGEEFTAQRHYGAQLNGAAIQAIGPGYGLELVGLEASKPELIAPIVDGLRGKTFRIRSIGSLALTLCYVAAGRLDGMIAARPSRSVDVAAAQLIAREAGASLKFDRLDLPQAHLDLGARYEVAAALDDEMLGTLLKVQRAAARAR
ncbi:MAG: inositol monophosphatase family protein [Solirubrobacterales bacterium]